MDLAPIAPIGTPPLGKSQPIQTISADQGPTIDDNAVRQAIAQAEANNQDPQSITMGDFAQGLAPNPAPKVQEVPQKFLKPDGAVDVEKIQASTKALDEAIATREPIPQKTVDDYLTEYREKEKVFRTQTVPKVPAPIAPPPVVDSPPQNFEDIVRRDYQADPLATTARLVDLIVAQRFAPLEEREKVEATRTNLQQLVAKDPRILQPDVYAAINAKLASDPDLWKLKNPHRSAWLEVKEEMRLGESQAGAQAQPSRPLSPVLGGGTPPSAPSSSASAPQDILSNLHELDLRKKDQEALGDEAIRQQLMASRG